MSEKYKAYSMPLRFVITVYFLEIITTDLQKIRFRSEN